MSPCHGRAAGARLPSVQKAPRVCPRCFVPASWDVLRNRFSLWSALPSEPEIGGESTPSRFTKGCGNRGSAPTLTSVTAPSSARSPSDGDGVVTATLQVFPGGCVCVRRTLAPALAADTGQGQIGGHLVKFEKSQKRCSLNHAHRSDTHVRPGGRVSGIKAPSLFSLRVVTAVFGHQVSRYGRQDGSRQRGRLRADSAPVPGPPRHASCLLRTLVGCSFRNLFLSARGRVWWLGGDSARQGALSVEACVGSVGLGHVLEHGAPHFLVDPASVFQTGGSRVCGTFLLKWLKVLGGPAGL